MSIEIYPYDADRYAETGDLFPDHVEDEDWNVFHGTSAQFSADIETAGLCWKPTISREDVRKLVAVFEGLDWCGRDTGGFRVLATYTQSDFGSADHKPIFFAQSAGRSVLYAERDWAGGETARACRRAIADLDTWVNDPDQHAQLREGNGIPDYLPGINAIRPALSVSWVRECLRDLRSLRVLCDQFAQTHNAGVVYAVRMSPDMVRHLGQEGGAGYSCHVPVPSAMIVGKLVVPPEIKCRRLIRGDSAATLRRMLADRPDPGCLRSLFREHIKGKER